MTHDEHMTMIAIDIDAKMRSFEVLIRDLRDQAAQLLLLIDGSPALHAGLDSIGQLNDNMDPEDGDEV